MPYIKVNDIQAYYEIHGDGEPLVLIVGLATDISEWEGIILRLAKKYQVLAFDNRGAGRTDKPETPYSIDMMADDTARLMQALGIEEAHIVGISMGDVSRWHWHFSIQRAPKSSSWYPHPREVSRVGGGTSSECSSVTLVYWLLGLSVPKQAVRSWLSRSLLLPTTSDLLKGRVF